MKKLNEALLVAVQITVTLLHCVLGDYELDVRFHIYFNVGSGCADCRPTVNGAGTSRCCDGNDFVGSCSASDRCDNYFVHCLRETGSEGPCLTDVITSGTNTDTAFIDFQGQSISFERPGRWEGIQFFTVVRDDDSPPGPSGSDELVDTFSIDLTTSFLIPGANFTTATFYRGSFGFGRLQLSFRVSCAANFFGPNCATECVPNDLTVCDENGISVCRPGRFGDSCEFFDNCFQNDQCDPNGECVDGDDTFTCECNAGFTGSQCLTNIDDCVNASCGQNGECVDQINNFDCMCDTGFTGADCMTNIDDCASANCSENSQCVDGVDSFSCVCSPGFKFNGTFCENAASQDDSPANTSAIIGGVLGGLFGSIALVLILVFLLVIAMRKTQQKERGASDVTAKQEHPHPADNPIYHSAWNSHLPQTVPFHNGSVAMATTTALSNGTGAVEYEREFDNPIYGSADFDDAGDSTSIDYAQLSVQHS